MVFCNNKYNERKNKSDSSHNPYFNRWFSAIQITLDVYFTNNEVTILILIDGFLQYNMVTKCK